MIKSAHSACNPKCPYFYDYSCLAPGECYNLNNKLIDNQTQININKIEQNENKKIAPT